MGSQTVPRRLSAERVEEFAGSAGEAYLPAAWDGFTVHYRYRETAYHVVVRHADSGATDGGAPRVLLDGAEQPGPVVPVVDDRREHSVEVRADSMPR